VAYTVFINYRGEDSQVCAFLLYDSLVKRFGESKIFLDCRSIRPGEDFQQKLLGSLRESSILLAVIGPRWLTTADRYGRRYIDSAGDWVRRELAEALALGLHVMPVLMDDVTIPPAEVLPVDIAGLSERQYVRLRRRDADEDLAHLIDRLVEFEPALDAAGAARVGPAAPPRQLPGAASHFVGRVGELDGLTRFLDGAHTAQAVVISAIGGTAGVGKTALAVHWAHQVRPRFPDGDLYADLRGYGPGLPLEPGAVLTGFLRALGVAGDDIPPELADRSARFRTLVDGRRMLVVLDNASAEEQVRPLLPGTSSCLVIVTSRSSLAGLVAREGASRLDLGLLPPTESVQLLRALIGNRVGREPAAARELADRCAHLPLALRLVAELAVARPARTLADLVAELADVRGRLDVLDAGGDPHTAVRAVFSWSYQLLPPGAARLFRLLGCHPGRTVDVPAAAALAQLPLPAARSLLEALFRAHLVDARAGDRYGMHDLLRDYAAELAGETDPPGDRDAAVARLLAYTLATTCAAMDLVAPHDDYRRPRLARAAERPRFANSGQALAWLESERANLVLTVRHAAGSTRPDWHDYVRQMSASLYRYFETRAYDDDAFAVHGYALTVCASGGDPRGYAMALADAGHVYERVGRYQDALDHLQKAIDLAREAGDRVTEARALNGRGANCSHLGYYDEAVEHHQRALQLALDDDNLSGRGHAWGHLGVVEQRRGHWAEALHHHQRALAVFRQDGNPTTQGRALNNLGSAYLELGDHAAAGAHYQQAADVARENGNRRIEITALNGLGNTALLTGSPEDALKYHLRALDNAREANDRRRQADAHDGLGHAHHSLGHRRSALCHWRQAFDLYAAVGAPQAEAVRARLDGAAGPPRAG
jgi:tetratricopeptide (TPR) repeat protein